jgi:hypothetical protein
MRRVVVDTTNCLLASISPVSPFYRLYTLFAAEVFSDTTQELGYYGVTERCFLMCVLM